MHIERFPGPTMTDTAADLDIDFDIAGILWCAQEG
jgi:hypothetical protein